VRFPLVDLSTSRLGDMPSRLPAFHLRIPALDAYYPAVSARAPTTPSETATSTAPEDKSGSGSPAIHRVLSHRGTIPFLKPTTAQIYLSPALQLEWYSRDHRKGRHPLRPGERRPITTFLRIEYWNISWWVAFVCPSRGESG